MFSKNIRVLITVEETGSSRATDGKAPRTGKQSPKHKIDAFCKALAENSERQTDLSFDMYHQCERSLSECVTLAIQRQIRAKEELRLLDEEVTVCQAALAEHRQREEGLWKEVDRRTDLIFDDYEQHALGKAQRERVIALRKEKEELRKRMADIDKALKDRK